MSKRLLLTSNSSNVGKTTIVTGLIRALQLKGYNVASFKSGPDYLDPLFHKEALGIYSSNLDLFLMGESYCKKILSSRSKQEDISIIEGAMGYYDGIGATTKASAWELSNITNTPTILIVDPNGMGSSLGALIHGFKTYRKNNQIVAIILNKTKPMLKNYYQNIIMKECKLPVLGVVPYIEECSFESQNLGLIPASEIKDIQYKINKIAQILLKTIDFDLLLDLADAPSINPPVIKNNIKKENVSIAIAKDQAFFFYYEDALKSLESMGVKWVPFSPINDHSLPDNIHGLYIGGGYPELYLELLDKNQSMKKSIKEAYSNKMPIIAESGGFAYLHESFMYKNKIYQLVGIIDGSVELTNRLQNFGYLQLKAKRNNLLCHRGEVLNSHEYHYTKSTNPGNDFSGIKPLSNRGWESIHANEYLFAGFPHIHLGANKNASNNFIKAALNYKRRIEWQKN